MTVNREPLPELLIEGYKLDEILEFPDEVLNKFVLTGDLIVLQIGSAEILGQFWLSESTLVLELAHINGGGEGVLPTMAMLASAYARRKSLTEIEWRVHAINCPKPNLKLQRVLDRRGFVIRNVVGSGQCYHRVVSVQP